VDNFGGKVVDNLWITFIRESWGVLDSGFLSSRIRC